MLNSTITVDRGCWAVARRTAAYRAVAGAWDVPVLLACSGGVDSMALLAIAVVARDAGRVGPFVAAHLDHGVRAGSEREGRVVAAAARALDCPFVQLRLNASDPQPGQGLEDELRAQRYTAFAQLVERLALGGVVTAHTKDDQVETILLRLLSGSSSLASAGMRASRRIKTSAGSLTVLRPLLDVTRANLTDVLNVFELPHIDDPSNADTRYRRNRIRHRVMPELAALDPGFGAGLIRAVGHAAIDARLADRLAAAEYRRNVQVDVDNVRLRRDWLAALDDAIATRVARMAILSLIEGDSRELTRERTLAVVGAAAGRTGATIELPYGLVARIGQDVVMISAREADGSA